MSRSGFGSRGTLALCAGLLLALSSPAQAQRRGRARAPAPELRDYVVQPGDSCWAIAQRLFGRGEAYRIIHRYNELGPMPHILTPGQILRLPAKGTAPEARVAWLQREVRAKAPTMVDWLAAKKDMGLWRLYKVSTGDQSAAGILFEDKSSLRMREKALLVIYGGAAARARLKRRPGSEVVLEKGAVRGGLGVLDEQARMRLRTPGARVELASRDTQVEVDEQKNSMVSVYDGKAEVAAQGDKVEVPKDHGTFVARGKKPTPPRRLPPAPRWDAASGDGVVLVPPGTLGRFEALWQAVPGAGRYRVELALDDKFRFPVVVAEVGAGVLRFRAQELKPGIYHARLAALDQNGLSSRYSRVITVQVAPIQSSRRLRPAAEGPGFEVAGLVKVQPPADLAEQLEVTLNEGAFAPATEPLRLAQPGSYRLRYRLRGHKAESALLLRVLAVQGQLSLPEAPLQVGGEAAPVTLSLSDERGEPAGLPGLTLTAYPGGALPLTRSGPGRYAASLPAPERYPQRPVTLVAHWPGGRLATGELTVEKPPEPPKPKPAPPPPPEVFQWPEFPAALEGAYPAAGVPGRSARPVTRVGLLTYVGRRAPRWSRDPGERTFVGLNLRGELALLSRRLGLDLELPLLQADLTDDPQSKSDLGDLRLGARYLALRWGGLALSPSLRLSLPTGGGGRIRRSLGLEPGVVLEWTWRGLLLLSTTQVLGLDLQVSADDPAPGETRGEGTTGLIYSASYDLGLRFLQRFVLAAELLTVITALQPWELPAQQGLAAGGAFRVDIDRLRLGLFGGAGLNDDGQALFGHYSVGLSLDLGFDWP